MKQPIYVTIPVSEDRDDFEVYQRNQYVSTVAPVTTLAEIIKHCPEVREEVRKMINNAITFGTYEPTEMEIENYINRKTQY